MASFVFTSILTVHLQAMAAEPTPPASGSPPAVHVPTIGVVGLHQASLDAAAQKELVGALVEAIEYEGRFDGVPTAEVRTAILGRESIVLEEGLLSGPREKLTLGRSAYNSAAWDESITHLTEAIGGFVGMFPGSNNPEDLWDAYVYLGSCELLRERPNEAAARAAFASAIALSPAKPVNPALFPPNVVSAYERMRSEVRATKAEVQVSAGIGADVWIDGVLRGLSPLTVPDVVPGEHHLVARTATSDGYLKFTVSTNLQPKIEVPLKNPSFGTPSASATRRSFQMAALYESLAARSGGLDYVLIAGTDGATLLLQLFHVQARTYSRTVEVPFVDSASDEAIRAIPLLLNGVAVDGSFVTTSPAPPAVDVTANSELVLLLTERIAAEPFRGSPAFPASYRPPESAEAEGTRRRVKAGTVLGIVAGTLALGGASAGGYYYLTQRETDPNQGLVIVQF